MATAIERAIASVPHAHAGSNVLPEERTLRRASESLEPARRWGLSTLQGRLCELTGPVSAPLLGAAIGLVHDAQLQKQPVAWVRAVGSLFFPPDVAACGVDLAALPIVRTPDARAAARACDHLLRSGAFGLVVADLGEGTSLPLPMQTRLNGLVHKHRSALLFLTRGSERKRPALGSLVSLRASITLERDPHDRFVRRIDVAKDKRHGPSWQSEELLHAPPGLC